MKIITYNNSCHIYYSKLIDVSIDLPEIVEKLIDILLIIEYNVN